MRILFGRTLAGNLSDAGSGVVKSIGPYLAASASRSGPVGPHSIPPLIVAGILGRIPPRPIVGHRAFDAEKLPVEIGNDEEERCGRFGHAAPWHGLQTLPRKIPKIGATPHRWRWRPGRGYLGRR